MRRKPQPLQPLSDVVGAGLAGLRAREFDALPFGGYAGELIGQAATPPPAPPPLVIPPPPWSEHYRPELDRDSQNPDRR